jgi:hypothetical protein
MNRPLNFSQIISVRTQHPEELVKMAEEWDDLQSTVDLMGYSGQHILASRDDPGHYLIVAEFASVDPGVSAAEEAEKNNERPETNEWARRLRAVAEGEPVFSDYDEIYRTSY